VDNSFVAWFLAALVLSWAMGAYNRLVRLRAKGLLAFSVLEQALLKQMMLVSSHVLEEAVATAETPEEGQRLLVSSKSVVAALKVAHSQPLNRAASSGLRESLAATIVCWQQLVALPPAVVDSFLPPSFQLQWAQFENQVERARSEFNQSVLDYNEAKNQFPANVLAKIFGFKSAQPI
jgi:LemA protein